MRHRMVDAGTAARRPSSDGDEDAPLFRTKRMVSSFRASSSVPASLHRPGLKHQLAASPSYTLLFFGFLHVAVFPLRATVSPLVSSHTSAFNPLSYLRLPVPRFITLLAFFTASLLLSPFALRFFPGSHSSVVAVCSRASFIAFRASSSAAPSSAFSAAVSDGRLHHPYLVPARCIGTRLLS